LALHVWKFKYYQLIRDIILQSMYMNRHQQAYATAKTSVGVTSNSFV
jgi:hypothetical protein